MAPIGPAVFTIGYETHTPESFVRVLRKAGVEKVLDIRELPLSRRRGFSKVRLKENLEAAEIEYEHLRLAGNPHRKLKASIETCLELYGEHLDRQPGVVEGVEAAIEGHRVALLCVESDAHLCHRSVLVNRLKGRQPDLRVVDL